MYKILVIYYRVLILVRYIYEGFILIGVKISLLSREFDVRLDNVD